MAAVYNIFLQLFAVIIASALVSASMEKQQNGGEFGKLSRLTGSGNQLQNWNGPGYWLGKRALVELADNPFGQFNKNRARFVNWNNIFRRGSGFSKRFGDEPKGFGAFNFQGGLQKWQ